MKTIHTPNVITAVLVLFILLAYGGSVFAYQVRIAQVDSSSLLLNQQVTLYVSVSDGASPVTHLSRRYFKLYEAPQHRPTNFQQVPILKFQGGVNREQGINFLLLVDNSGSMYLSLDGKQEPNAAKRRISSARRVLGTFLDSMTNPKDKVGLAAFHAFYQDYGKPSRDKHGIKEAVAKIKRPQGHEDHTEIYASITRAVDDLASLKGRKAIIVLSDGENEYYTDLEKKPHPDYGTKRYLPRETIRRCQQEGISVFAINFGVGQMKARQLGRVARESGGLVFDATSEGSLQNMYGRIVNLIRSEYRITYPATMAPADVKIAKVALTVPRAGTATGTREYFSSTVFGLPAREVPWFMLLLFLLPWLLIWLLSRLNFGRTVAGPALDFIGGKGTVAFESGFKGHTQALDRSTRTVIGLGGPQTVVMDKGGTVSGDNATIVFDRSKNAYVLNATVPIKVNNQTVQTKVLKSGDVISAGDKTVVFDAGVE